VEDFSCEKEIKNEKLKIKKRPFDKLRVTAGSLLIVFIAEILTN
jgi:hypothetical protein